MSDYFIYITEYNIGGIHIIVEIRISYYLYKDTSYWCVLYDGGVYIICIFK